MNERLRSQESQQPQGWQGVRWDKQSPGANSEPAQPASALNRFLGGSPGVVLLRLAVMSLAVGALLVWMDIRPDEIFYALERFMHRIWFMGFDAVREILRYIVAGAVIVVPIWLLMRLFSARGR